MSVLDLLGVRKPDRGSVHRPRPFCSRPTVKLLEVRALFSSIPLKPNSMPPTVVGRQSVVVPHSFPTLLLSFSESREGARR